MSSEERRNFYGKQAIIEEMLDSLSLPESGYSLRMEAFKAEQMLHIYLKGDSSEWKRVRSYPFCKFSGQLGPKLKEGDRQIPEGIYRVAVFNPKSKFYLSLGLDYPNKRDMLIADAENPGSDIYIHGGCQTVGCIPITDEKMAELFLLAKSASPEIEVVILPFELTSSNKKKYYSEFSQWKSFWENLFLDVEKLRG